MKHESILIGAFILVLCFSGLTLLFGFNITGIPLFFHKITQVTFMSSSKNTDYQTPYYQEKVAQFSQNPGSQQDIFLVGDSLTDQGNWIELLNKTNIKNRGISGDPTTGVLNRLDEIINAQPRQIFIMIGVNDLWNEDKTVDEIISNYREILTKFQKETPKTQVYIQSLLPINDQDYPIKISNETIMEVNQKLQGLATEFKYEYLNIYPHFIDKSNQLKPNYTNDGVHLTIEGYQVWAKAIAQWINE